MSNELIQMGWAETPENVPLVEWTGNPGSTLGGYFAWLSTFCLGPRGGACRILAGPGKGHWGRATAPHLPALAWQDPVGSEPSASKSG